MSAWETVPDSDDRDWMGMNFAGKVCIYLHSDGPWSDNCDCGDREWEVQLPEGWMWVDHRGPGPFDTLAAAMDYAVSLHPDHTDVTRSLGLDQWIFSPNRAPV